MNIGSLIYARRNRARAGTAPMAVVAALVGLALAGSTALAAPALADSGPASANASSGSSAASATSAQSGGSTGSGAPGTAANPSGAASSSSAADTAADTAANSGADLPAQLSASAQAKATGKPVQVAALTTETVAVTANPSGDFTMTSSAQPVRVQKNGSWTAIDPNLVADPDGSYSPAAAALPLAFSGGGASPMITISAPGSTQSHPQSLAISWPTILPKPTISGNAALYANVLPGVDLRLADTGNSYSEVLIVHSAAAAANPALAALRLNVQSTGLTLKKTAQGGLTAADSTGATVFTGQTPIMWDSSINTRKGPAPTADNPGSGIVTTLPDALSSAGASHPAALAAGTTAASTSKASNTGSYSLTLTPPAAALTGGKKFPLYLDPTFDLGSSEWITVDSQGGEWTNGSSDGAVEVGDCNLTTGSDPCAIDAAFRTYFDMKTTPLGGSNGTHATVTGADFTITQTWNGENGCTATPVDLYGSGYADSSTNWPGPITTYINSVSSGYGNGCAAHSIDIPVLALGKSAAAGDWTTTTVALRAANESTIDQWKNFDDNPMLSVDYAYPPDAASALDVTGATCNGTFYVNTTTPKLTATAKDNNSPALDTKLTFTINGHTGTADPASGAVGSWTVTPALTPNTSYTYTVAVSNGYVSAPSVSTSGAFTILAPPTTTPVISSSDYPPGYWGQPTSTGGQFTVSSPDPNLQGFVYTLSGAGTEKAADSTACDTSPVANLTGGQLTDGFVPITNGGNAAIAIPPGLSVGYHTLDVKSVDYANNESHESATYAFYVAPATSVSSANLALSKAVTVSSTVATGTWGAANLTNGVLTPTTTNMGWSSVAHTAAAGTEWAEVNLGAAQTIDDVTLYPRNDVNNSGSGFPTAFTIATSTDNATWTTVDTEVSYPTPGNSPQRYTFPATSAQYVKITATGLSTDSIGTSYYMQLKQIAVYNGVTTNRYEAEDANLLKTGTVPVNGDNTWTSVQGASTHPGWSSGAQVFFNGTQAGDKFTLSFTAPAEGDYALGADMTQATDYGQLSYAIDSTPLLANGQATFDGYRTPCCGNTYVQLGGAHLTAGTHTLTMTMTGTNAASLANRYNAGVDYLTIAPINGATDASFTAAMNNHGITPDSQTSTANLDLTFAADALSAKALATAGLTTTGPVTLDGDSFQLTPANSAGYDNVIALGQTIENPVPAAPTSSIALLVAATAGAASGGQVTVTYTDGTTSQAVLGTTPDWATPVAGITPAVVLPSYDVGTGATPTTGNRDLYTITIPTDNSKTIASITLPTYHTTMAPNSGSSALHVLAIGTHASSPTTVLNGTAANWIGTWAAPADTTTGSVASPAFANQTLREVVHPSTSGTGAGAQVRVRLTNTRSASPVTFSAVSLAAQAAGTGPGTLAAPTALTFGGSANVTVNPGTEIYSDPVTVPATTGGTGNLVVSMAVSGSAAIAPQHSGASTYGAGSPTYVATGNTTTDQAGALTTWSKTLGGWYYLEDADVTSTDTTGSTAQGTVVILSDQTSLATGTDGRTWADDLPAALADTTDNPGVVDSAPGGIVNLSTNGATAASALTNLATTVGDEPNVRTVIIDLGTNDLTAGTDYATIESNLTTLVNDLTTIKFDGAPINVYLTTIAPDTATAFSTAQESTREAVNNDITSPSNWGYAGYIDFDTTATGCGAQNSGSPDTTLPALLTGGLPNSSYYSDFADAATSPVMPTGVGPLVRHRVS